MMSCGCGRISETIALGSIAVTEQAVSVERLFFHAQLPASQLSVRPKPVV